MGYICHHAVIFIGWQEVEMELAHAAVMSAVEEAGLPSRLVTPLVETAINGNRTFAILPDGSKEGWGTSDRGEDARDAAVRAATTACPYVRWAEVEMPEDRDARVTRCDRSNEPRRGE